MAGQLHKTLKLLVRANQWLNHLEANESSSITHIVRTHKQSQVSETETAWRNKPDPQTEMCSKENTTACTDSELFTHCMLLTHIC